MNTQIIEIKEYLEGSNLMENMYDVSKLIRTLETELHFTTNINKDDYNYLNTVIYKIKVNLTKVKAIISLQD